MLRKLISQLPRPTMAARTETSVTLSMARLARATSNDQVESPVAAVTATARCLLGPGGGHQGLLHMSWVWISMMEPV